ncbi:hypothetical protein ACIQNG_15795 [Streptomyces sp. NPDC091377]|uniref:hypothetical protein n=1 Tax=Streptomyces sp. NPDC091377 TaxID=3365995 RepID=UPI00381B9D83
MASKSSARPGSGAKPSQEATRWGSVWSFAFFVSNRYRISPAVLFPLLIDELEELGSETVPDGVDPLGEISEINSPSAHAPLTQTAPDDESEAE